jgi:hypothetical protein
MSTVQGVGEGGGGGGCLFHSTAVVEQVWLWYFKAVVHCFQNYSGWRVICAMKILLISGVVTFWTLANPTVLAIIPQNLEKYFF